MSWRESLRIIPEVSPSKPSMFMTLTGMLSRLFRLKSPQISGLIPASPEVISYSYTPFGVQLGESVSGYTYSGEYYDVSVGMLDLRALWYKPTPMIFYQSDI